MFEEIINFWFNELTPQQRFQKDEKFDDLLSKKFGNLLQSAAMCELYEWRDHPPGRLAEIIILDQFSRNIYRDRAESFAQDALALALSQQAHKLEDAKHLTADQTVFLYMPYMHSESKLIHVQAEKIFQNVGVESVYEYELKHKAIIDRFGRYPHRNKILGRSSTDEEIEFLKSPGSSF